MSLETGSTQHAEVPPVPARVPGSVQGALREAGVLPDWNTGLNARLCEWVENRHWLYEAELPDVWLAGGAAVRLNAAGLDYSGWVFLNGREAGVFTGSFVPHVFDLAPFLAASGNRLSIVFDGPPRWLGQFGYTSRMTEWKPRFNYTWDWTSRLVQTGIWDALTLDVVDGPELGEVQTLPLMRNGKAALAVRCTLPRLENGETWLHAALDKEGETVWTESVPSTMTEEGVLWGENVPAVEPWWPNGDGPQPLYTLRLEMRDDDGRLLDSQERRIGFKQVAWLPCPEGPEQADPWLCVINGRPIFLQGVNWTPIRPNFADVSDAEYRQRLELYRDMGCNVLRVWGGAFLEKQVFYDICDELGLLVWQEFPLSSSGTDNWPPEDAQSIGEMEAIARSYIRRRQRHACLLLWCGGNELQGTLDGGKEGCGKPCGLSHPLLRRLAEVVAEEDPGRRYLPTSSSGPRFTADEKEFGLGVHWDVHGPWQAEGGIHDAWARYWENDDALFRSEAGAPGASPADVIRAFKGGLEELPGTADNPLWRRTSWWIEWPAFVSEQGREPESLEEYLEWSQNRQAEALSIAAKACKDRFPRCGGFIVWMGHDSFPCTANTAIVDFHGRPKPAALALAKVFLGPSGGV